MGPNKPFKDLAWGLASNGVAVLRYVKRTARYGLKAAYDPPSYTVDDEIVNDARAAVELAAKQPKIDAKRIFVLGHSEGGYVAARIADCDAQMRELFCWQLRSGRWRNWCLSKFTILRGFREFRRSKRRIK
jgi:uncharacterized protein